MRSSHVKLVLTRKIKNWATTSSNYYTIFIFLFFSAGRFFKEDYNGEMECSVEKCSLFPAATCFSVK